MGRGACSRLVRISPPSHNKSNVTVGSNVLQLLGKSRAIEMHDRTPSDGSTLVMYDYDNLRKGTMRDDFKAALEARHRP